MVELNATQSSAIHAVIGAGQIGRELARMLGEAGYTVRLARRGAPGAPMPGVTWMQGDVTDPAFAAAVCADAEVVYNCANPTDYHKWETFLAPLFKGILDAASAASARLVLLDNLYMYGSVEGPLTEDLPMKPNSLKGELRKKMTELALEAQAQGRVDVAIGRAADFFGPHTANSVYGDRLLEALDRNKAIEGFGDIDLPRSYSYSLDVAFGLAVLGTQEQAMGQIWHLPVSAQGTTRSFAEAIASAHGSEVKFRMMPRWAVKALGIFIPTIGAMVEMLYQWEAPFVVDDSKLREAFGVQATPLAEAAAQTVAAWKQQRDAA